jgi:NAD(P)-dependent dehydrogenase (short-subunit alcohol dehydrogenase family)
MSHWVIAGASRGIGLELVRQLAMRGEQVTASLRAGAPREALEAALAPAGSKGRILHFDTRDEAAARAAAAQASGLYLWRRPRKDRKSVV